MRMTHVDRDRYSRQIILPGFGEEAQRRLANSKVLVMGMGGLGSPVSLYLAAAGVGELGLCDFDRVERHNLHRQVLHDEPAIGRAKVESAAERLAALNPEVSLHLHPEGLHVDNAMELVSRYDLIVDGSDNFPTRFLTSDAARLAGKPLVYGSIFQHEGQLTVFPGDAGGPCYRCLFAGMPEPGTVPNCAEAGVLGALPGVIGSLQAMEAIKWLSGFGEPIIGRMLVYDALRTRFREVRLKVDPECPLCGANAEIRSLESHRYSWVCEVAEEKGELPWEVDVFELKRQIDRGEVALLDVREPEECSICRLSGAVEIPLRDLGRHCVGLDAGRHWIVYCHHGMRSLQATRMLRERGFGTVQNLRGGIDAWAREIAPEMARY